MFAFLLTMTLHDWRPSLLEAIAINITWVSYLKTFIRAALRQLGCSAPSKPTWSNTNQANDKKKRGKERSKGSKMQKGRTLLETWCCPDTSFSRSFLYSASLSWCNCLGISKFLSCSEAHDSWATKRQERPQNLAPSKQWERCLLRTWNLKLAFCNTWVLSGLSPLGKFVECFLISLEQAQSSKI